MKIKQLKIFRQEENPNIKKQLFNGVTYNLTGGIDVRATFNKENARSRETWHEPQSVLREAPRLPTSLRLLTLWRDFHFNSVSRKHLFARSASPAGLKRNPRDTASCWFDSLIFSCSSTARKQKRPQDDS